MDRSFLGLNSQEFLEKARTTIRKVKGSSQRSREAFRGLRAWVDAKKDMSDDNASEVSNGYGGRTRLPRDSALGQLDLAFSSVDDEESIANEDLEDIMDTLDVFFNNISVEDLEEDYDISANMSADLLKIFGKVSNNSTSSNTSTTDWKPPERPGMDNSAPIIATSKNITASSVDYSRSSQEKAQAQAKGVAPSRISSITSSPADSKAAWTPVRIDNKALTDFKRGSSARDDVSDDGSSETSSVYSESKGSASGRRNYDGKGYYDDETSTVSTESSIDDSESSFLNSGPVMSANLMEALGYDTRGIDRTTDWKPPDRPGLNNSEPIIKR